MNSVAVASTSSEVTMYLGYFFYLYF
jgi:hypothetical protein